MKKGCFKTTFFAFHGWSSNPMNIKANKEYIEQEIEEPYKNIKFTC
jgi:hypothetical protein